MNSREFPYGTRHKATAYSAHLVQLCKLLIQETFPEFLEASVQQSSVIVMAKKTRRLFHSYRDIKQNKLR